MTATYRDGEEDDPVGQNPLAVDPLRGPRRVPVGRAAASNIGQPPPRIVQRRMNALLATVSTKDTDPVILAQRLPKGSAGSPHGAARLIADTLPPSN